MDLETLIFRDDIMKRFKEERRGSMVVGPGFWFARQVGVASRRDCLSCCYYGITAITIMARISRKSNRFRKIQLHNLHFFFRGLFFLLSAGGEQSSFYIRSQCSPFFVSLQPSSNIKIGLFSAYVRKLCHIFFIFGKRDFSKILLAFQIHVIKFLVNWLINKVLV